MQEQLLSFCVNVFTSLARYSSPMFDIKVVYVSVLTPSSGPIHLPLFIPPTVFLALFFLRFTLNRSLISSRVSRFGETNCLAFALTREVVTSLITHSPPVTLFSIHSWGKRLRSPELQNSIQGPIYFMWGTDHEDQVGSEAFDERFVFEVIFSIFPSVKFILCLISRL